MWVFFEVVFPLTRLIKLKEKRNDLCKKFDWRILVRPRTDPRSGFLPGRASFEFDGLRLDA